MQTDTLPISSTLERGGGAFMPDVAMIASAALRRDVASRNAPLAGVFMSDVLKASGAASMGPN
eukprot:364998-Chlamydomonas_euryale.AAC.8